MILYNLFRLILYIIILFTSIFNKKVRFFFNKRIFNYKLKIENKKEETILIHLSSVGELNLSEELIKKLEEKNKKIVLSVMTDTGYDLAKKKFAKNNNIEMILFPLDDYLLLKKIYKKLKIKETIIIETEIWPNLYNIASKNGKLFIINGRLTEKRMKSYLKIKKIIKKILLKADKILVQSDGDKLRYEKITDKNPKIKVYKSLKYSIKYEKLKKDSKEKYYNNIIFKNKKIIVCGSTRNGEEKIWLNIYKKINICNEYQLILVPRHLERVKEIEKEINKIQLKYSKLSENKKNDIIIVDKMGVLRDFYQMADYTFVGGTLVNIGGHSILEPLFYGKIPIIGHYYQNIEDIVRDAEKENFIKIVKTENEIIEYIKKFKKIDTKSFFDKNNEIDKIINEIS